MTQPNTMPPDPAHRRPSGRRRASRLAPALLAAALALLPAARAEAADPVNPIAGVRFEPRVQLAGQSLLLNGTGLRAVAFFKGYAAALYLPLRSDRVDQVVAPGGAKRLQIRMLVDVPVAEFVKAFHKGVDRNTPETQHAGLKARMARFDGMLEPLVEMKKGDTVNLDLMPGQGMQFWLNGRAVGTPIEGEDFYAALLLIFIGDKPVDDALKAGLLGRSA